MSLDFEDLVRRTVERRRLFHRHPETGWTEYYTTAKIAETLEPLGLGITFGGEFVKPETVMGAPADRDAHRRRAVEWGADPKIVGRIGDATGLLAMIDTGRPGPLTALRFDIDCVDVTECSEASHRPTAEGFPSENPGEMHACGHDGHTAMGLGLAELLTSNLDGLKGKILLVFQPAEEGVRGGYAVAASGAVDQADTFIALHLGLGFPTGTVFGGTDGFLCTTKFDVTFTGEAAHAGGAPELGRNALLGAAAAALNLHAIAPNSHGVTRINVGVLRAGEGRNVIPPKAFMKVETRGGTDELEQYVYGRAMEVIRGAAEMYGLTSQVEKVGQSIGGASSPELAELVCQVAREVPGAVDVRPRRLMSGSDDAAWLMKTVQDRGGLATYIGLGATTSAGHHNARFDFDEACLPIGLRLLEGVVRRLNG